MERYLIITVGLPGLGKSTFVYNHFQVLGAVRVVSFDEAKNGKQGDQLRQVQTVIASSDTIIEHLADTAGTTYEQEFARSSKVADQMFKANCMAALGHGYSLIIDRTMLTKKARSRVLQWLQNQKKYRGTYKKVAIVFDGSVDLSWDRTSGRIIHRRGLTRNHLVDMQKMLEHPTVEEGFDMVMSTQAASLYFDRDRFAAMRGHQSDA